MCFRCSLVSCWHGCVCVAFSNVDAYYKQLYKCDHAHGWVFRVAHPADRCDKWTAHPANLQVLAGVLLTIVDNSGPKDDVAWGLWFTVAAICSDVLCEGQTWLQAVMANTEFMEAAAVVEAIRAMVVAVVPYKQVIIVPACGNMGVTVPYWRW